MLPHGHTGAPGDGKSHKWCFAVTRKETGVGIFSAVELLLEVLTSVAWKILLLQEVIINKSINSQ